MRDTSPQRDNFSEFLEAKIDQVAPRNLDSAHLGMVEGHHQPQLSIALRQNTIKPEMVLV